MEKAPRTKVPQKREMDNRGTITTSLKNSRTQRKSARSGKRPTSDEKTRPIDGRLVLRSRPRPQQPAIEETPEQPRPSTPRLYQEYIPMEKVEIGSDTDQDPSVLEIPAVNWTINVGVKSVQCIEMGNAPRIKRLGPRQRGEGDRK